jgi:hypothetical protein
MSLVEHCLATLADHIDRVPDLSGVPEHLIAALFAVSSSTERPRLLSTAAGLSSRSPTPPCTRTEAYCILAVGSGAWQAYA